MTSVLVPSYATYMDNPWFRWEGVSVSSCAPPPRMHVLSPWLLVHGFAAAWIVYATRPGPKGSNGTMCGRQTWWVNVLGFQCHALLAVTVAAALTRRARPCRRTHTDAPCGCVPSKGRLTQTRTRAALMVFSGGTAVLASTRDVPAAFGVAVLTLVAALVAWYHGVMAAANFTSAADRRCCTCDLGLWWGGWMLAGVGSATVWTVCTAPNIGAI